MDTNQLFKILNLYSFVKTEDQRTDEKFVGQRLWEHKLMQKQRNAVSFCKKLSAINTNDLSKITNEEKESVENCLRENFLKDDPNYFGTRDVIYIDLHNYDY
jgi:hypothetical protein